MPLINHLYRRWQEMRADRLRGEESRQEIIRELDAEAKHRACEKIASRLKKADRYSGHPDTYYSEAEKRIAGFRWQLYRLNRPFVFLEKKIIKPLNFWSDRVDIFQFFSKASPIGILAIPFVILFYEIQRNRKQDIFQKEIFSGQVEVRQQQAVRNYLSQITVIYLEITEENNPEKNGDLKELLYSTTIAIFHELSIKEDSFYESSKVRKSNSKVFEFDEIAIEKDRKSQVINFLSDSGWIHRSEEEKPLLSLSESNLSKANLSETNLSKTNLSFTNLILADLTGANLTGADLTKANLTGANLTGADLTGTNLTKANLTEAKLENITFCRTIMSDGTIDNRNCNDFILN